jgi:hypothetical protein
MPRKSNKLLRTTAHAGGHISVHGKLPNDKRGKRRDFINF